MLEGLFTILQLRLISTSKDFVLLQRYCELIPLTDIIILEVGMVGVRKLTS